MGGRNTTHAKRLSEFQKTESNEIGIDPHDHSPAGIKQKIYHLEIGDRVEWVGRKESREIPQDVIEKRKEGNRYIFICEGPGGGRYALDPGGDNNPRVRDEKNHSFNENLQYLFVTNSKF